MNEEAITTIAKGKAIRRAMMFCAEIGSQDVVLEGDAKRVIGEVDSLDEIWSEHGIKRSKHQWSISFSPREGIKAAHFLAKYALQVEEIVWLEECPDVIKSCILLKKKCSDVIV